MEVGISGPQLSIHQMQEIKSDDVNCTLLFQSGGGDAVGGRAQSFKSDCGIHQFPISDSKSRTDEVPENYFKEELLENAIHLRWEQLGLQLLSRNSRWQRLQCTMLCLPPWAVTVFEGEEGKAGLKFSEEQRKTYHRSFFKFASGAAVLNAAEAHELVQGLVPFDPTRTELSKCISDVLGASKSSRGLFDFELFVRLLCTVQRAREAGAPVDAAKSFFDLVRNCFPLDPEGGFKQSWDAVITLLLLYSSFEIPYRFAFDGQDDESPPLAFNLTLDFIFTLDVVLSFFTSYFDSKGILVRDLSCIARHYLLSWFIPDIGGSFPFDKVVEAATQSTGDVGALRVLKFVRLIKLLRAVAVFRRLNELGRRNHLKLFRTGFAVGRSTLLIFFTAHLLGCIFVAMIDQGSDDNWLYKYDRRLMSTSSGTRYVTALYWAMISLTTMGYGDVTPSNHNERIFCIFVALAGAIVFPYCIGVISSLILTLTGAEYRISERLNTLAEYMDFRGISDERQRALNGFYAFSWRETGELYKERKILGELSAPLRREVLCEIGRKFKGTVAIFQGFDDDCVGYVATRLKRVDLLEGETVYVRGERADDLYLVGQGSVALHFDGHVPLKRRKSSLGRSFSETCTQTTVADRVIEKGEFFGELALFPQVAGRFRLESAVARSWTTLFSLSVDEIPKLESTYPAFVTLLREYCELHVAHCKADGLLTACDVSLCGRSRAVEPCPMKSRISCLKRELIHLKEEHLLARAMSVNESANAGLQTRVYRFMSMSLSTSMDKSDWIHASCTMRLSGEVLCILHTQEGLTSEAPLSLGFLIPGASSLRIMDSSEVQAQLGTCRLGGARMYGCEFWTLPKDGSLDTSSIIHSASMRKFHVFSWIDEEFQHFVNTAQSILKVGDQGSLHLCCRSDETSKELPSDTKQRLDVGDYLIQDTSAPCMGMKHVHLAKFGSDPDYLKPLVFKKLDENPSYEPFDIASHAEWFVKEMLESTNYPERFNRFLHQVLWIHTKLLGISLRKMILETRGMDLNLAVHHVKQDENFASDSNGANQTFDFSQGELKISQPSVFSASGCECDTTGSGNNVLESDKQVSLSSESSGIDKVGYVDLRWKHFAERLIRAKSSWRLLLRKFGAVPPEIDKIYDDLQNNHGMELTQDQRQKYYRVYFRAAKGIGLMSQPQVVDVVLGELQFNVSDVVLSRLISDVCMRYPSGSGLFDFELFADLLFELIKTKERSATKNTFGAYSWPHQIFPLHPESVYKQTWDSIVILLLFYSSFQIPYDLAFDKGSQNDDKSDPSWNFNIFLDIIFMLDVGAAFVTSYFNKKGILVTHLKTIALNYLQTWFIPDFGGSFPFDRIIRSVSDSSINYGVLRVLKIVRMVKLLRAVKVFRVLAAIAQKEGFGSYRKLIGVFRALVTLIFFSHLFGCIFVSMIDVKSSENWINTYDKRILNSGDWGVYSTALYWAFISITTMGYGDIRPVTAQERLFVIFVALACSLVFSFCMGTITSMLMTVTGAQYRALKKNQEVAEYVQFRNLTKDLEIKIKRFYLVSYQGSAPFYLERRLIDEFSTPLAKAVLIEIGSKAKAELPLLQGFQDECAGYIMTRLKRLDLVEGEHIYARNDLATEMFIIAHGSVSLHLDGNTTSQLSSGSPTSGGANFPPSSSGVRTIEKGGTFGELALFPKLAAPYRAETAVARTWVSLLTLSVDELDPLELRFPSFVAALREMCELLVSGYGALGCLVTAEDVRTSELAEAEGSRLRSNISHMRRELLLVKERSVLAPLSGPNGGRVVHLLRQTSQPHAAPSHSAPLSDSWVTFSCVVCGSGQLLAIDHSHVGLARTAPEPLGFLVAGRSACRLLAADEARRSVAESQRGAAEIFGCELVVYDRPPGEGVSGAEEPHGSALTVFSWLEEEFQYFMEAVESVLDP